MPVLMQIIRQDGMVVAPGEPVEQATVALAPSILQPGPTPEAQRSSLPVWLQH